MLCPSVLNEAQLPDAWEGKSVRVYWFSNKVRYVIPKDVGISKKYLKTETDLNQELKLLLKLTAGHRWITESHPLSMQYNYT